MAASAARELLELTRRRQDEMTELLRALALAESPSDVPQSQAAAQDVLCGALERLGYDVQKIPGERTGGHLLARPPNRSATGPTQLLLGHCDTVWPLGTVEQMPVVIRDGRLYGPGVYDMKGGLVQAIFALEAVQRLGRRLDVAPIVLINSDEEIGSPESADQICRLAAEADRVLVMEPSLGPSGHLKTARKGVGRFTIRVVGQAAHAGLAPQRGASAILELTYVVQRLFAMNDPQRGITVNVGTIDGGLRPNVVAPESRAEVDVRAATLADAEHVQRAIHALEPVTPGIRLEVRGGFGRPPMEPTPGNRRLWQLARQSAEHLGLPLDEAAAGGASDGNLTCRLAPTLDGLGAVGDGAHAVDECVVLDTMAERAALLAMLLLAPPLASEDRGEPASRYPVARYSRE